MSLGKLLTTGKSLIGLHSGEARYRMRDKNPLPKFESAKNPFASKGQGEPVASGEEKDMEKSNMTPAEIAAAKMKKTQRLPVLGPDGLPVAPMPVARSAESDERAEVTKPSSVIDSWAKKLNPLVWWENRKPAPVKSAVPRFNKAPVQGELSLDNIKVMRNDLSEADVEIVSAKPKVAKAAKVPKTAEVASMSGDVSAAAMAIPELPPATNAWEYLGERLLGKH